MDQHRFFETVITSLQDPVSYMDRDLTYVFVNQAYEVWFGVPRQDIIGMTLPELVGPDAYAKLRPKLEAALAGEGQSFEVLMPYRGAGTKFVRVRYIPDRDANGGVTGLIVIVNDISDERQRELAAQLEESRQYLRLILDSSQLGMFGTDLRGRVTFINRRALELLAYEHEREFLGRPMHEMVHHTFANGSPHPPESCPMRDSALTRRTHHVLDDVFWKKTGESIPVAFYSVPMLFNDECLGTVVTFEDLTSRRALEQSLEHERMKSVRSAKLASLGEMSAGIAHEINNPLAVLTGTVTFLADLAHEPEKLRAKVQVLSKNCARIARIVRGLQKFSRTGDKPNLQTHAIGKIVQEALTLTEARTRRHGVEVRVEDHARQAIRCDEVEIEQVIINLINNAIDAVGTRDERWVELRLADEADAVVLRVSDSGPGIAEDIRHRVFEPFFTTKEIGQGTGLGLSITKGILDEHKATISIAPRGGPTCFEIRFPSVPFAQ